VILIGVTGGSGSGKTTFARKVAKFSQKNISLLHLDSYYLPQLPAICFNDKNQANFDHPQAFDWKLLKDHLELLKEGHHIQCPIYDFVTSSRTQETVKVESTPVVLVEGIFTLFHPEIRDLLEIKCFLRVDSDIRFIRRLHRDVEERGRSLDSVISQYYETVRPMYRKFLEPQEQYADFIIGEETDNAAMILASRIRELY
jgi:uridine kinase